MTGNLPSARADFYFFSYSDSAANTASGTLVATDLGGGTYLATGGVLTVTGSVAGTFSLISGGPSTFLIPGFIVNNVLYPSSDPVLDIYGLAFVNGNTYLNIWGNSAGNYSFYTYNASTGTYGVQFSGISSATLSAIPEPAAAGLLWAIAFAIVLLGNRSRAGGKTHFSGRRPAADRRLEQFGRR